jgi:WD40 repeat protein
VLQPDPPDDPSLVVTKVGREVVFPPRLSFSRYPSQHALAEEPVPGNPEVTQLRVYHLQDGKTFGQGVACSQQLDQWATRRDLSASGSFFVAAVREQKSPTILVFAPLEGKLRTTITLGPTVEDKFGLALAGPRRLLTAHLDPGGEVLVEFRDLIRTELGPTTIRYQPQQNERFDFATLAASPGGRYAALLTQRGEKLLIWDLYHSKLAAVREFPRAGLWPGLAFSPDGKRLARLGTSEPEYQVTVIDLASGKPLVSQSFHGELAGKTSYHGPRLEWSTSGKHLVFGGHDLIDARTGKLVDAIRHTSERGGFAWCRIVNDDLLLHQVDGKRSDHYAARPLAEMLASAPPLESEPAAEPPTEPAVAEADPPAETTGQEPMPGTIGATWKLPAIAWSVEVDPPREPAAELTKAMPIACPSESLKVVVPRQHRPFVAFYQLERKPSTRLQIQGFDLRTGKSVGSSVDTAFDSPLRAEYPELGPDGKLLVARLTYEFPLEYVVFSLAEGRQVAKLSLPEGRTLGCAARFLDERRLLTTHYDKARECWATTWDAQTGEQLAQVRLDSAKHCRSGKPEVSPGGRYVALRGALNHEVGIWRLSDGQLAGAYQMPDGLLSGDISFSPDGTRLVFVNDHFQRDPTGMDGYHRVHMLDVASGKAVFDARFRPAMMNLLAKSQPIQWSPDQKWLLIDEKDVLEAATGKWVARLEHGKTTPVAGAIRLVGPDHVLHLAGPWQNHSLQVSSIKSSWQPPKVPVVKLPAPGTAPVAAVIKPDPPVARPRPTESKPGDPPTEVATDSPAAREAVWKLALDPPAAPVSYKSGKFSTKIENFDQLLFPHGPSRFCLVKESATGQRKHWVMDLGSGKAIGKPVTEPEIRGHAPVLSPDGRYLADFFPSNREIAVWSFATGEQICQLPKSDRAFEEFTFAGPHQLAVVDSEDLKLNLTVWDVRTGKQLSRAIIRDESASGSSLAIAPSPGGKYLAVVAEHDLLLVDLAGPTVVGRRSLRYLGDRDAIRLFGAWLDLSHVECDGIAWSAVGHRLALTLRSGNDGFLVCLDAANGGVVFERLLRGNEFGHFDFRDEDGNPLDWLPDGSAILVGGTRLYDAQTGKDLYTLPTDPTGDNHPRRIIPPWDVLTVAEGADGDDYLVSLPLPKDALAKALEQTRGAGEAVDSLLPPLTVASLEGAATIDAAHAPGAWQSLADGVEPIAGLPDRLEIADADRRVSRVRFAAPSSGKLAVVSTKYTSDGRGKTTSSVEIQQVDARAKRRGPAIEIAPQYDLADVSPDGQFALLRLADAPFRFERLDLVGINPKKHVAGWRPYASVDAIDAARGEGKPKNIHWAGLVDAEHALSLSEAGRLVLWKLPECRAVWQLAGVPIHDGITFSPGRRFVALRIGSRMLLLESLTGKVLAQPELPAGAHIGRIAFRPDGRECYVTYMQPQQYPQIRRLDAATGKVLDEFPMSVLGTSTYVYADSTIFRSDDVALVNGELLVDLRRKLLLWRYVLADRFQLAEHSPDGRVWYHGDSQGGRPIELIAVDPLREEVRTAARELTPAEQYIIRKGDRIRLAIDLAGAGLGAAAKRIEAAITDRLTSGGLVIDPAAAVTLSVVGSERTDTIDFRRASGQVVSVQDVKVVVRFSLSDSAGRVVWGHEAVNPPVIDLSKPLAGQAEGDLMAKKRALVERMILEHIVGGIPTEKTKDPREFLPGESLLGPAGEEPVPAEKRLPPRPTGLERAAP